MKVATSNKRLDEEMFTEALAKGMYSSPRAAKTAIAKSLMKPRTKGRLRKLVDTNTKWGKANSSKKRAGAKGKNLRGRAKGVHRSTSKEPFVVLFYNTASAGKDDLLDFLRGAANHGMTLPALIEALESCG
jgi:hypothetical protein